MKAVTAVPGKPELCGISELSDPVPSPGQLLVEGVLAGVCSTDRDVVHSTHGSLPPGQERMVLFHESLGRVLHAPAISGFRNGDHVVGVVRRPDPEPCGACAAGEWDFCRNGRYTECGIKELDGFGSQQWAIEPRFAIRVPPGLDELGVLIEPTSTVAKAWEQVEVIGARAYYSPRHVLVTGAGPIGLLSALLGQERGLDVHVFDQVTSGPKPGLVRQLGATYHSELDDLGFEPDVVIEATGAGEVVFEVLRRTARNSITVLTGIAGHERTVPVPLGALNDELVMDNDVVVGSVNANLRHYSQAARSLAAADRGWLAALLTRRVRLADWADALEHRPDDVKTVVDLRA